MRRFFFNNSHWLDQIFSAFIGLFLVFASADTLANFQFEHLAAEYQPLARFGLILMMFLIVFFVMQISAKQSRRAGLGFSAAINKSLLKSGDSVYVKLSKPKKEFAGIIDIENSASHQFCITSVSGNQIMVLIQNIVKIFDEI